ncbi:MAG: hypothetical protein PHR44_01705 [Candidatus Omnitrophica bacterium]|nr:hypothetical protein [Candidatus Omnitrophota bacterium]
MRLTGGYFCNIIPFMSRVNILQVITELELGGAQKNCLAILRSLDRAVYDPFLATGKEGILLKDAVSLEGVRVESIPFLRREINFFLTCLPFSISTVS